MPTEEEIAFRRARTRLQFANGARAVFESGIPQQAIRGVGNFTTSYIQASATNPLMATFGVLMLANAARGVGFIGPVEHTTIRTGSAAYLAAEIISGALPGSAGRGSPSITYDVPDVAVPTLPPRRELSEGEQLLLLPAPIIAARKSEKKVRGRNGSPAPATRPLEELTREQQRQRSQREPFGRGSEEEFIDVKGREVPKPVAAMPGVTTTDLVVAAGIGGGAAVAASGGRGAGSRGASPARPGREFGEVGL